MPDPTNPKSRIVPDPPAQLVPAAQAYAELQVATNFSLLRGASHADELVFRAAALGYRAIAVTDRNTLAGIVRMHEAAKQCGLKLVIGVRLVLNDCPDVLLWPADRPAYARLCRLLTTGKRRAEKGHCALWLADLLVALAEASGLLAAIVPPEPLDDTIEPIIARLAEAAGGAAADRLSIATSCLYQGTETTRVRDLVELSCVTSVPLLSTNDVHYHDRDRRALQDVLTCIRHLCTVHDAGYRLFPNGERYLKSPAQMHHVFRALPAAIARGVAIADRCTFTLDELRYEYPQELVPPGVSITQHLRNLTEAGLLHRYPQGTPEKVRKQVEHELKLIAQLKYEAYFLTVHDIVLYARSRGILCQGRGSAANSAVCYCLGVTSVDPNEIDVLFERFVSAARKEPPDIDVDFEHERREEVIQYVYQKYGRQRVGMTAEVITYRGRSAVRDVGKALGLSLDLVDQMAKRLDGWSAGAMTDDQLRAINLDPADRTIRRVVALTSQLLGFPRHLGQHVGGLIMTQTPLCEMVPIENASMVDRTVIEWDKDDIDTVGMLKVDVLALGMLTCISKAFTMIATQAEIHHGGTEARRDIRRMENAERGMENGECSNSRMSPCLTVLHSPFPVLHCSFSSSSVSPCLRGESPPPRLELHHFKPTDPVVYDMICRADTIGVFQIESRAQMSMLPRLRPRTFYDLVIEVAIVRPGPIQGNMVHPYLRRRSGQEEVTFPSEALRGVLHKTLGVPLFQEQAMKVAMVAAGFTADEADQLRKAMAAWRKTAKLEEFRDKIINGMLDRHYTRQFAEQTFDQIRGFGEYGFPESHAASFALLVYVSCWLKRYHPAAFAAALINSQPMGFYAPAQILRDAQEHGVKVLAIDVNFSEWDCVLMEERQAHHGGTEARRDVCANCMVEENAKARRHEEDAEEIESQEKSHRGTEAQRAVGTKDASAPKPDLRDVDSEKAQVNCSPSAPLCLCGSSSSSDKVCLASLDGSVSDTGFQPVPGALDNEKSTIAKASRTTHGLEARVTDGVVRLPTDGLSIPDDPLAPPAAWGLGGPAIRLGMRMVKGLRIDHVQRLVEERQRNGTFNSVRELRLRTAIPKAALQRLAEADAFASMGLPRREALWQVLGLEQEEAPLFEEWEREQMQAASRIRHGLETPATEAGSSFILHPSSFILPKMPLGQEVMTDYVTFGLSLKSHPVALVRAELTARKIITAAAIREQRHGQWVRVAGLVLVRQQPGTASGIVFETLEDETGIVNLIVRPKVYDQYKQAARYGTMIEAQGIVERQGDVVHVMVKKMEDLTWMVDGLWTRSRDFH